MSCVLSSLVAVSVTATNVQPRVSALTAVPVTMPFEAHQGAVTVEAGLGAGLPLRAVLDTGVSECMVSGSAASERGLKGTGEVVIASPFGPLQAVPVGAYTLRIGRLLVEGLPLCTGDPLAQLSDKPPTPPPDLWVGNSCLSLFTLEIDGPAKQINLGRPDAPPMRSTAPFAFTLDQGRVMVRALANGTADFRAVISTGVRGTLVTPTVGRRMGQDIVGERTVRMPGGGKARVGWGRLKELRLGATKIANVDVLAVLDDVPGVGGEIGVIGTDVLLRYRMQISYSRMQMQLAPSQRDGRERSR